MTTYKQPSLDKFLESLSPEQLLFLGEICNEYMSGATELISWIADKIRRRRLEFSNVELEQASDKCILKFYENLRHPGDFINNRLKGNMTEKEFEELSFNSPILLADGQMGLVTRIPQFSCYAEIGVQVPGEEDIRWINISNINCLSNGALLELSSAIKK
jgi:hypothetical protein